MSWRFFMASDSKLNDYDNEMVRIKETKDGTILIGQPGFEGKSIRIFDFEAGEEKDRQFTSKKFIKHVEFVCNEENASVFAEYIKLNMERCKQIELWRIWESDKEIPKKRKVKINELNAEDIDSVWGVDGYDNDCLVICQSYTYGK